MILPNKHVKLSDSLLNVGAILLEQIDNTQTITALRDDVEIKSKIRTYEKFILGLDLLFIFSLIEYQNGIIKKVKL